MDTPFGVQQYCTLKHLDDPTPGAIQSCMQKNYWSYEAFAKNPRCKDLGDQCKRQCSPGFWGSCPSTLNASSPFCGTDCAYPLYRQESSCSNLEKNCPAGCCGRKSPSPESFWDKQHSMNSLGFCMNWAAGDEEAYEKCLQGQWYLPIRR